MNINESYNKFMNNLSLMSLNPQIALMSFLKLSAEMVKDPNKIKEAQKDLVNKLIDLSEYATKKILNQDTSNLKKTGDKNFKGNEWDEYFYFDIAKQYYLTIAEWMKDTINNIEVVDHDLKLKSNFFLNSFLDAVHPKNFPLLNPEVIKKTIKHNGENLYNGFEMFLQDLQNGAITTNDQSFYKIGENIATTPGKVIFKNALIELIQYEPSTEKAFKTPILFIPPWINKFYILDLCKEESFVKWLVDQGFTVFIISWVNPDKRYAEFSFEDYATEGVIEAINKIHEITKSALINTIGYCVGGTLIASILGALSDKNCKVKPKAKINSATLLTTPLDFSHPGELSIFIDEFYLKLIGNDLEREGLLRGEVMYNTFNALKANDMIWRYVVNRYMLGNTPTPHSILFWNADTMNITKNMQLFLSKSLYRDNVIKEKKFSFLGTNVDLKNIDVPIYMVSMLKDHLVPWKTTYDGLKLFKNVVRFVVGGSGHVAGVVNPPYRNKYSYWTNHNTTVSADNWLKNAIEHKGSWWNDLLEWLKPLSGDLIKSRQIKDYMYDAPGLYVTNQLSEDCIISPELIKISKRLKELNC